MMADRKKARKVSVLALAVCLGVLSLLSTRCNNPTGTDADQQPYITIRNSCGIELDIYMDGAYQFFLNNNEYYTIENVTPGTHLLEAKKMGTATLVKSQTAEIATDFGYTWTITSSAKLNITNNYGEALDIYGDGTFRTELPDQTDLLLPNVPYGEHLIEAKKAGGTTVVASTTIDFTEDMTYTWTIQK